MYAVIETGGKQYRVELGTELEVELLDVEPGQEIDLERILLIADGDRASVGQPIVADAAVKARVLRQDRGVKTISFKYRPKARSRVKKGHRQELTVLKITDVRFGDKSAAAEAQEVAEKAKAEHDLVVAAATRQAAEDASLAARLAKRVRTEGAEEAKDAKDADTSKAAKKPAKSPAAAADKTAAAAKPAKVKAEPKTETKAKAVAEPAPKADAPKKRARTKKDE
jgi:large subunit ribosomal protein L21